MTMFDIVARVQVFHDATGFRPAKAFVSYDAAMQLLGSVSEGVPPTEGHFGHQALGVADWYVDLTLAGDELRLEA